MHYAEKNARIKSMLRPVAPQHDLGALPGTVPADSEWSEGVAPLARRASNGLPVGSAEAAAAVRKLQEKREDDVSPSEMLGLEAIILPKIRRLARPNLAS